MSQLTSVMLSLFLGAALAKCQKYTAWSEGVNLGPAINTPFTDGCPFIVKSDLSLYFASNRPGGYGGMDIWVSHRDSIHDPWETPVNAGPAINGPGNEVCPTVTIDGHRFYFVSDRPGGCGGNDLYVSRRRNKRDDFGWGAPQNLGCTVNSAFSDITPTLFEDDATCREFLYFSSDRPGGPGGMDIYLSSRYSDGDFGPPLLVTELNTSSNDQRPNIRKDGLEILFESDRPGTLGSTDLLSATRENTLDPFSLPVNLGLVNSSAGENRPSISFDGTHLYFMSNRPGGTGGVDLYVATRTKRRR